MLKLKLILFTLLFYIVTNGLYVLITSLIEDFVGALYVDVLISLLTLAVVFSFVYFTSKKQIHYSFKNMSLVMIMICLVGIPIFARIFCDVFIRIEQILGYKEIPNVSNQVYEDYILYHNIIVYALAIPIYEELFFRGYIIEELRNKVNFWNIVLFSSILFALIHINPYDEYWNVINLATPFFLGICSGLVYLWGKNILYPILVHICHVSGGCDH